MLEVLALTLVVLTGIYFCALAVAALLVPAKASRFLLGFASSPRVHYIELSIRFLVGVALVIYAPRMSASGAFSLFGLGAILFQLSAHRLQTQRILACEFLVARLEVGRGLRPQVFFELLLFPHLCDQPLTESRMRREPFVKFGDLAAQILFFDFEKRLRVLLFQAPDEEAEESAN